MPITSSNGRVHHQDGSATQQVQAEAVCRAMEVAGTVSSRHQFFLWLRLHLHRFMPHEFLMCRLGPQACGQGDQIVVFNCTPLSDPLLAQLQAPDDGLWRQLLAAWQDAGHRPTVLDLRNSAAMPASAATGLSAAGYPQLYIHGLNPAWGLHPSFKMVWGRQRLETHDAGSPAWAESWQQADEDALQAALTWLPYLHHAAARALRDDERRQLQTGGGSSSAHAHVLTERELEVLRALRDARSNAQIGEQLGISALTVKNHLRKIMRKLGAANRVQAVAEAMARHMIH